MTEAKQLPTLTDKQAAAFWGRVDSSGGADACHPWQGEIHRRYGRTRISGSNYRAHRLAAKLSGKRVPTNMVIAHLCDNPVCCNPRHLRVTGEKWNARDRAAKGRSGRVLAYSDETVAKFKTEVKGGGAVPTAAARYGIARATAYAIATGRQRKDIEPRGAVIKTRTRAAPIGWSKVLVVRRARVRNRTFDEIVELTGLKHGTVVDICTRGRECHRPPEAERKCVEVLKGYIRRYGQTAAATRLGWDELTLKFELIHMAEREGCES